MCSTCGATVVDQPRSSAAIARELGVPWDTVNAIAVEDTTGLLAADTARLQSVRVIGVDEQRWAHTRRAAATAM